MIDGSRPFGLHCIFDFNYLRPFMSSTIPWGADFSGSVVHR